MTASTDPTSLAELMAMTIEAAKATAETAALVCRALLDHAYEIPTWAWVQGAAKPYALGLHYGYPKCCIADFARDLPWMDDPANADRYAVAIGADLGYVPCHECAARLLPTITTEVPA